ncbi:Asp-tRNA(Asn)/Glu-tRNA(Gln) amidotransferase subunit GatC [Desulfofalx alkaliphila]|uniref:Asp-tRNA(Asn)/Glu-tRNA(Gln) amidotransferase subunit GatC n=1 Tax=Desulfofalx alkaliphila TaxID=105483 RepID=UPI0004E13D1A|nr:Asp-tRNA(Asn)/Glu-tRNA(Gln) amidotransferase subunit GatC [Desulfofalx alkaliphila]
MIGNKELEQMALMSRLELKEEEKELYTKQLNDILEEAKVLQEPDTDEVQPTVYVLPINNVFREDVVGEHLANEKVLANAPESEGNFIKVPKII